MGTIILTYIVADDGVITTSETRRELQVHRRVVHLIDLDRNNLLQLLDLLLNLNSLCGLITEALDEGLHVSHFLLLVLIGPYLLLAALLSQHDILIILHLIVDHLPARDFQRAVRHIIYKGTVMTHKDDCTRRLGQELLQPLNRLDIEVVGGLVKQEHIGFLEEYLGQLDTHAPTS